MSRFDNLKERVDPLLLEDFQLGSHDAWDDDLLDECYCELFPISVFLKGNKELLVGAKGTGKSAVFRRLQEKKIHFENPKKFDQIIISIKEAIEYASIKALVASTFDSLDESSDAKFHFFWEIYCLYRVILELKINHSNVYSKLPKDAEAFLSGFAEKNGGISGFLKSIKTSIGVRLDYSNPNMITPDFYLSAENGKGIKDKKSINIVAIDSLKQNICKLLKSEKKIIYILVDNLDDFVSREEFQTQMSVIQGLVQTCQYYTRLQALKIKISIRPELYEKVDFAKLGGKDKIDPRTVVLIWNENDIRKFIGKRLLNNYEKLFSLRKNKGIIFHPNENELYRTDKRPNGFWSKIFKSIGFEFRRIRDSREASSIDLTDQFNKSLITLIFPRRIKHYAANGIVQDNADIFEYLSSHLCLAGGLIVPRVYLRYLNMVFEISIQHYKSNEHEHIKQDENGEYPLIKREYMLVAYAKMQNAMRDVCKSSMISPDWKRKFSMMLEKQGKNSVLGYRKLRNIIEEFNDDEAALFLAYCNHIGLLYCKNTMDSLHSRKYEYPILFQRIWHQE